MRRLALRLALTLPLAAIACGSPNTADEVVPLTIDQVEVQVLESFPVQIMAVVTGTLPTACSSIDSVDQRREGNVIDVTITTRTERDQVCILIIQPVTERVRLQGSFPPGEYLLRVNGKDTRFQV